MEINEIIDKQKSFFNTEITLSYSFRINMLKKLEKSIRDNYNEILEAFKKDLNKKEFDVISTELLMVFNEIKYFKKHLKGLMRGKIAKTGLLTFASKGRIVSNPRGVVLIVAPWNYPLQLTMLPLIGAIAAGNTAVVKPSSYSGNVSSVINKILSVFDDEYIICIEGGREQNSKLFEGKFDFIFFTGSQNVAKALMEKASCNLVPVLLELGGKSPCIVDDDADIKLAAKRIVWGKYLNAGQTCVAPDYVLVHSSLKEKFINNIKLEIKNQFYDDCGLTKDFPCIINQKHVERLKTLIDKEKLVCGGAVKDRLIEPTVMSGVNYDDEVMQQEIFGPILPIIEFENFSAVKTRLNNLPKPLALYYFGKNPEHIRDVKYSMSFGGGCINDVIMHLTEHNLPFGGVGESGMGCYHSKKSFETFSHQKCLLLKSKCEFDTRYCPHDAKKSKLLKRMAKIK